MGWRFGAIAITIRKKEATVQIQTIRTGSPLDNLSYLIFDEQGDAFVVDPWDGEDCARRVRAAGGKIKAVLNTHEHGDHTRGNAWLKNEAGVEVWGHPNHPGIDRPLPDGESIRLSSRHTLESWSTPGHTFAHACFVLKERGEPLALFSGDTLFPAGVGNCRNGGDARTLYLSVSQRLKPLADRVSLFSGHDYLINNLAFGRSLLKDDETLASWEKKAQDARNRDALITTTMGDERRINLFLRLEDPAVRAALRQSGDVELKTDEDVFLSLRKRRDVW